MANKTEYEKCLEETDGNKKLCDGLSGDPNPGEWSEDKDGSQNTLNSILGVGAVGIGLWLTYKLIT